MNKLNDKIWLAKDAARVIARYLQICYLWIPLEDTGADEEELAEIRDISRRLHGCDIAIELDLYLWNKLNHLADEELEALFFKEFCDPLLYESIKVRFQEFKLLNIKLYDES